MRRRTHHKPKMTIPMAVVAGFVPVAVGLWNRRSSSTEMGNYLQAGFTGVDPSTRKFDIQNFRMGLFPIACGFMAHMVAVKLGINRAIARAGVPLIRI